MGAGRGPVNTAAVIEALRSSADALAADVAMWAARDPANPSRGALQARKDALQVIDTLTSELYQLRRELAPGAHRRRR